jgi:cystathionine gamma-synthase
MTPEEAGKLAYEMASKVRMTGQRTASTTSTTIDPHPSSSSTNLHIDSLLAHAGIATNTANATTSIVNDDKAYEEFVNIPMSPPLHLSTTYTRPPDGHYQSCDLIYIREDNPTRLLLESTIFQLETHGGNADSNSTFDFDINDIPSSPTVNSSFAFSSGMMAASAIILSHSSSIHVILPKDLYHGVSSVLKNVFTRFNVTVSHIDISTEDLTELQNEVISKSAEVNDIIVWIETPSNPLCNVIDITKVCTLVSKCKNNITTVVDSTLAPPICTQPLKFGADIVIHSATKYLGGHSDALCGVVTTSPWTKRGIALDSKVKQVQRSMGGVASTFDSWLILRGLRTLRYRFEQQCKNAMALASFLVNQKLLVKNVYYPGLSNPNYPHQHEIAKQQMSKSTTDNETILYGGVLSVEMYTEQQAYAFAGAVQLIHRATSLGGTETLIEHRYSIEPVGHQTSPKGLLRISVGIENTIDLINDIQFALNIVSKMNL